ncbi:hypothetical protein [Paenibacillus sp. Cedars]|nr:hypothetical protein [Paenibacillus sp. Cedars]
MTENITISGIFPITVARKKTAEVHLADRRGCIDGRCRDERKQPGR